MEYYIDRGVLGVSKESSHTIFEYRGAPVPAHNRTKWDSQQNLVMPTMPPTLIGVCRLIQLYYVLKVSVNVVFVPTYVTQTFPALYFSSFRSVSITYITSCHISHCSPTSKQGLFSPIPL